MNTLNPVMLFLAPYLAAGLTAFCLIIHKGGGVSLKACGTAGYYGLIGGALAPVCAGCPIPGLASLTKLEKLIAFSVAIGAQIICVPLLKQHAANALKNWTSDDQS